MIRIAVLSGKGGTGKTVVTAALATLASSPLMLVDCDVDAANLHVLLSATEVRKEPFYGMKKAKVDPERCTLCGACLKTCRFGAISMNEIHVEVNPIRCEGCATCTLICPEWAIQMVQQKDGEILRSDTPYGPLYHAELEPGSGNSGLLVHEVKKRALAESTEDTLLLIDGPPGIGCPVISTITGMDQVLAVTEPSVSGLHDLIRLKDLVRGFDLPMFVIINKWDLNEELTDRIEQFCQSEGLSFLGRIPFDPDVYKSVQEGVPLTQRDTPAATAVRRVWDTLV
jgi:MinD superfamily P-loop ATPase containing an inserted ferredoxin domain